DVRAVGDALELAPPHRELVFDVGRPLGVVGELLPRVLPEAETRAADAVALVPGEALLDPALVPDLVRRPAGDQIVRIDEVLDLHLLELVRAEDEIPWRSLGAKGLP